MRIWTALKNKKFRKAPVSRQARRGMRGFTLIEFMTASTILTSGLLGLAALLSAGIQANALGGNTNTALTLAQSKVEELRNLPSTSAARANGGSLTTSQSGYNDTSSIFVRRWSLTAGPGSAQICTVRVSPVNTQNAMRKTVVLTTIIR